MKRRDLLKLAGAAAALSAAGCATTGNGKARVVVVGGGYGGATAAKYLKLWDPSIDVTLVGSRSGLPLQAKPLLEARPRFARPQYTPDQTVVFSKAKI